MKITCIRRLGIDSTDFIVSSGVVLPLFFIGNRMFSNFFFNLISFLIALITEDSALLSDHGS